MTPNDQGGAAIDLESIDAGRLRDVAYSADVSLEGTTKTAEIVERLREANVRFGTDGWMKGNESFDLEERPSGGNGPSDTTAVYALKRENEHCDEVIGIFEEALEDTDYVVREDSTESGKNTWSVVLPAEAQEPEPTEDDEGDSDEGGDEQDLADMTRDEVYEIARSWTSTVAPGWTRPSWSKPWRSTGARSRPRASFFAAVSERRIRRLGPLAARYVRGHHTEPPARWKRAPVLSERGDAGSNAQYPRRFRSPRIPTLTTHRKTGFSALIPVSSTSVTFGLLC